MILHHLIQSGRSTAGREEDWSSEIEQQRVLMEEWECTTAFIHHIQESFTPFPPAHAMCYTTGTALHRGPAQIPALDSPIK
eukprot:1159430-Pelagomonas_calceolata.AAC.2